MRVGGLTSSGELFSQDLQSNTIHLELDSFDGEGKSISATAFKPTFDYIGLDGRRIIKIHVDYFGDYAPVIEHCDLELNLEFLESDGSKSVQVKRKISKDGKTVNIDGLLKMRSMKNELTYNGHTISVEHDPFCYISLPMHQGMHQGSENGENGLLTERDPCQSAGCVKVVPWRLKYLTDHGNTVRSSLTVMVAWTGELQASLLHSHWSS